MIIWNLGGISTESRRNLQPVENIVIQTTTMFSTTFQTGVVENIATTHNSHSCFQNLNVTLFSSDDDNVFKSRWQCFQMTISQLKTLQCNFRLVPDGSARSDIDVHIYISIKVRWTGVEPVRSAPAASFEHLALALAVRE